MGFKGAQHRNVRPIFSCRRLEGNATKAKDSKNRNSWALSPDESLVGAISNEFTLLFWNIESHDEIPMAKFETVPPSEAIEILQFEWSSDGALVAINIDGTVHLWGIPLG